MEMKDLPNAKDRKAAERAEKRRRASTYTHHNRAQLRGDEGMSVQCPRCAAQVFYLFNDQTVDCENCGELISL